MSEHVEFPELTPEAKECLFAAYTAVAPWHEGFKEDWSKANRKAFAALLREAMKQALRPVSSTLWRELNAIADNLHSPPPPFPTLAQARAADLETQEGIETVRAFLATLGKGGQP
jgi:hypothetical protein